MKLKGLFTIMAAALMLSMSFTSCEELDGLFDDENESTDNQAFFPNSYRQRTVAAWYSLTEKEENGTRIEAVFLFDDNSFVTTKSRTYTDGRSQERKILAEGDYTLTGDYENGTAEVKINGTPEPMTVEIKDGKMLAMGETFTKQNNKKVPKPSEESEGGEGGGGQGGQGQGGNDHIEAFFPTNFSTKTVSAWYSEAGEMQEQGYDMKYNASIYFFTDGIFVATVHTVIDGPQGPVTNKAISISGEYSILQGDFTNGTIKLKGSDGKEVTVELKEGKLTYVEVDGRYTIYVKQDNSNVPKPSDPDNNGQQGGQGDVSGVEAFFPSSYAGKLLLVWYKYVQVKENSTRVEAVFLFADGTFVATKNKVYSKEDGRSPEREIVAEGAYSLISGDYQDGVLRGILANGETRDITIENGIMKANGDDFAMQNATELPEPSDPTNNGQQGGGEGDEVLAFFPNQFANSTVIAWYSFKEGEPAETRVMAVFLLEGNLAVVTQNKVFGESTGMNPERYILDYGKYQLTEGSDYENGSATVILERLGEKRVTINNGILRVDGLYGDYTKRDNADVPKPLDPTDQGQQGGEGDGDDDGDGDGDGDSVEFDQSLVKAYLPSDFSSEAIAAWYMYYGEDNNSCRVESVFLFNDNTLVVTKTKIYSKADGRAPEYKVTDKGQYRLAEGSDYENGTASVVTASGMSFDVVIEDGIMSAMDLEFALVPNDLLSIMTTNGK